MKRKARRIGVGVVGGIVLLIGILMIPYPGPGWLVVFLGLGILATEFAWAKRALVYAKGKYNAFTRWVKRQNTIVKAVIWLATGAIVFVTVWLLGGYGMINGWLDLGWEWAQSPLPLFN